MIASPLCGSSTGQPSLHREVLVPTSGMVVIMDSPMPTPWVAPSVPPVPPLFYLPIYSPDLNRSSSSSLSSNIGCAKPHCEPATPSTVPTPRASPPSHRPKVGLIRAARFFSDRLSQPMQLPNGARVSDAL